MRTIPHQIILAAAIQKIKEQAALGIWNGKEANPYFMACSWYLEELECSILFMKEAGYHSSGWWKNPDYERCYHLSIGYRSGNRSRIEGKLLPKFFGANERLIWIEAPYYQEGKKNDVWHYRLFCDPNWQPVKPRGEVYSTQFTELGWKSFSEKNK